METWCAPGKACLPRVSGLSPPQSLMPASSSAVQLRCRLSVAPAPASTGVRFGGACEVQQAPDFRTRGWLVLL